MARSQRTPVNPAELHREHVAEARELHQNATSDAARLHFDKAAGAHGTAQRLIERGPKLQRDADRFRASADLAQARGNRSLAADFRRRADEHDRAAASIPDQVAKWSNAGVEHAAAGREKEAAHVAIDRVEVSAATAFADQARWAAHLNAEPVPQPKPEPQPVENAASSDDGNGSRRRGPKE